MLGILNLSTITAFSSHPCPQLEGEDYDVAEEEEEERGGRGRSLEGEV